MTDRTEEELRRQNAAYAERFESVEDDALKRLRQRVAGVGGEDADQLVRGINSVLRERGAE